MAKFDLKFKDCYVETDTIQVEVCNGIIGIYGNHGESYFEIDLDKSTAIKFAKTLRTEINKITESEVMSFKEGDFTTATGTPKK